MPVVTVSSGASIDMVTVRQQAAEFVTFATGLLVTRLPDGTTFRFTGTFDFTGSGQPVGTINDLTVTGSNEQTLYSVTGIALAFDQAISLSASGDPLALDRAIFAGADTITGGSAADLIAAGAGDDVVVSSGGLDSLRGEAGNDTFRVTSASHLAGLSIDGGDGTDTVELAIGSATNGTNISWDLSGAQFTGVERVMLSPTVNGATTSLTMDAGQLHNASLTIDSVQAGIQVIRTILASGALNLSNLIVGNGFQQAGDSIIVDGSGATSALTITGSATADSITGGLAADSITGGAGDDILIGGSNSLSTGNDGAITTTRVQAATDGGSPIALTSSLTYATSTGTGSLTLSGSLTGTVLQSASQLKNVVFVVDISGSTSGDALPYGSVPTGLDFNKDGWQDTILDYELKAVSDTIAFLNSSGLGAVNVGLVAFDDTAGTVAIGQGAYTSASNQTGLDAALATLFDFGGTDFSVGLTQSVSLLNSMPDSAGGPTENLIIFLTDGSAYVPDADITAAAQSLATVEAFAIGSGSSTAALTFDSNSPTQTLDVTQIRQVIQTSITRDLAVSDIASVTMRINGGETVVIDQFTIVNGEIRFEQPLTGLSSDPNDINRVELTVVSATLGGSATTILNIPGSGVADRADTLDGGAGDDSLSGGHGNDLLLGGDGNDTLIGGAGADTMTGGSGADLFRLTEGADSHSFNTDSITDFGAGDRLTVDQLTLLDVVTLITPDTPIGAIGTLAEGQVLVVLGTDAATLHIGQGQGLADIVVRLEGQYAIDNLGVLDGSLIWTESTITGQPGVSPAAPAEDFTIAASPVSAVAEFVWRPSFATATDMMLL
jgi:serralysin